MREYNKKVDEIIPKYIQFSSDDQRFHDAYGKMILVKRISAFEQMEHITEWAKCVLNETVEFVAYV
jgi:hypothetical protein